MFKNFFHYLFLKKATAKDIIRICEKEHLIYTPQNIDNLLKGNQKGIRYGNLVMQQNNSGTLRSVFLKVQLDGKVKTYIPFCRQVKITEALDKDSAYSSPTPKVFSYSLNSRVPYALFETREEGPDFGFMHDTPSFYEKITQEQVRNLVDAIYSFHKAGKNISPTVWKYAEKIQSHLLFYKKEMAEWLSTRVTHKSEKGEFSTHTVEEFLASIFQTKDVRSRIFKIFEECWIYIDKTKKDTPYLTHADMQIDNMYKHSNGTFELLDFEWVGKSNNPMTAIMYDYGNLRARAWSSPHFQDTFDQAFIEVGKKYYFDPKIIEVGMTLGKLRSSLLMARYHLDFNNTVKKDRRSEEDYFHMFPRTLSALKSTLNL